MDSQELKTPEQKRKNKKLALYLLIPVMLIMFGFTYVQVPLFKMFCQKIGFAISPLSDVEYADTGRMCKVLYTGVVAGTLPVHFKAKQSVQTVEVGKPFENEYRFVNMSKDTVHFRPVHSILPEAAATKFTMTKCFCFDDQTMAPGEEKTFKVISVLSADMDSQVEQVTLNYTLFEKNPEEMEKNRQVPNVAQNSGGN
ncbi:MAG: cytochrome c oxidase assembly protein [Calditrichaeota bacterium]|nr:cytochrome c oxidase assembly protein [Calditrichota bacterium]MCB9365798.1 cytochrome c oxidase assembly protein [Calditrichota bacterium]